MARTEYAEEVAPSEQLKPTDLRDAVRPESAEIGVSEANTKARKQREDVRQHHLAWLQKKHLGIKTNKKQNKGE